MITFRSATSISELGAIAIIVGGTTTIVLASIAAAFTRACPPRKIALGAVAALAVNCFLSRTVATGSLLGSNQRANTVMDLWQRRLDRFVKFGGEARLLTPLAVVTGSNSGVGMSSAENLLACGWKVVMACRNQKAAEEARRNIVQAAQARLESRYRGLTDPAQKARAAQLSSMVAANATISPLDVSDVRSIRAFAKELGEIEGTAGSDSTVDGLATYHDGLRLLMNNAGIFQHGYGHWSPEGVEGMLNTNYAGPAYLTHLVIRDIIKPRISEGKETPFRIIGLSSCLHVQSFQKLTCAEIKETLGAMGDRTQTLENNTLLVRQNDTYSVSKFLMIAHAQNIKADAEQQGWAQDGLVTAYSVHPGGVRTAVFRGLKGILNLEYLVFSQLAFKSQHNGASNQTYLSLMLLEEQAGKDPLTQSVLAAADKPIPSSARLGDSSVVKAASSGKYLIDIGEASGPGQISVHANDEVFKIVGDWTDKMIARFEAVV